MNDGKNISIRAIMQNDMDSVIELLQLMSESKPSKSDFLSIWNIFSKQPNVHSLVAVMDNQIVGYGSIVIETKIKIIINCKKNLFLEDVNTFRSDINPKININT